MDKTHLIGSLRKKGFSEKIIQAFEKVKREKFVPERFATYAYEDMALPLDDGSTISQPYTIAFMLSLLEPKQGNKILELGSGSGYALALLSEMIKDGKIYGIEINRKLAVSSRNLFENDSNIEIFNRDGSNGLKEFAPFDRILVSAAFSSIPRHLYPQLKENGIMVSAVNQSIYKIEKKDSEIIEKEFPGFSFVPMKE